MLFKIIILWTPKTFCSRWFSSTDASRTRNYPTLGGAPLYVSKCVLQGIGDI